MLVETVLSMVTGVCHLKKVAHRTWATFQARLAFTLATFNLLVQWHGLQPDAQGFIHLSLAEFSLCGTSLRIVRVCPRVSQRCRPDHAFYVPQRSHSTRTHESVDAV